MDMKTRAAFDDDEDLEALRLAALQTLKKKTSDLSPSPPSVNIQPKVEIVPHAPIVRRPRNDFKRTGHWGRHMQNNSFQRHRNPNLITIVPIAETPDSSSSEIQAPNAVKPAKPILAMNMSSSKLILPQDRYCKTDANPEEKQSEVSTKFDRFEHSSSESSGEESDAEGGEAPAEAGAEAGASDAEPDPDVLLVKDDDGDDSLEKLMNEMEEEMATDNVQVNSRTKNKVKVEHGASKKKPSKSTKEESKVSCEVVSASGTHDWSPDSSAVRTGQVKVKAVSPPARSPPRGFSPRPTRSRSPSRSPPKVSPPRLKPAPYFSPRGRSPVRSRSPRSPLRRSRSPRRKYSPYAASPRPRRSPRRSPSPRGRRSPPRRSPIRRSPPRWLSPRRQSISPKFRRQSVSPARRLSSPRPRRSVSPRRVSPPLSYRRRSPSPARRNLSPPPRRYSPPRRNPSPPRRRPSPYRTPPPASGRNASPWTPPTSLPRQQRSPSPAYKRKATPPSPYGGPRRRRSDSPGGWPEKGFAGRSPPRRRPLQESRLNNIRRSQSPPPPLPAPASPAKSWSCTSSLSLSPSPERAADAEGPRRVKSPLRVRKRLPADFAYADGPTTAATAMEVEPAAAAPAPRKRKSKEGKGKTKKTRPRRADGTAKPRDKGAPDSAKSVLEARRRKFESSVPIESSNKKIRLKKSNNPDAKMAAAPTMEIQPPQTDDLEELLDLELENAVELWSDDETDSDNDARYKTNVIASASLGKELPKIRPVPPAKLLAPQTDEKARTRLSPNSDDKTVREQGAYSAKEGTTKRDVKNGRNPEKILKVESEKPKDSLVEKRSRTEMPEVGEDQDDGKDDLRAELSRRRAERLTMAGSVHETLSARLVQTAFKDVVGKKNLRQLERNKRHGVMKKPDSVKGTEGGGGGDGRRVMVLKSSVIEQQVPSISVTIPKEEKHKPPKGKIPIHMRLGMPAAGSFSEERERPVGGRRRASHKVKLKRNVLLATSAGDKVKCGSSHFLTLGSMRHNLLCSFPIFPLAPLGSECVQSNVRARPSHTWMALTSYFASFRENIYQTILIATSVFKGMPLEKYCGNSVISSVM